MFVIILLFVVIIEVGVLLLFLMFFKYFIDICSGCSVIKSVYDFCKWCYGCILILMKECNNLN